MEPGNYHVMPLDDLREHEFVSCWCHPDVDDDGLVIHHSMDRREAFETGERLAS